MSAKHPVVLKAIVLDLARVGTHVNHPGVGNPVPVSVWKGIFFE
jgi:hypothetical protein